MNLSRSTMAAVLGRCFLTVISVLALESNLPAETMLYSGLVVTDVRVGAGTPLLHNASLKVTFEGNKNDIQQVPMISSIECSGQPSFYYLAKGVARMEIEFQGRTRTARLNDGQIFVALDACNGGIGFGAFTGPFGMEVAYPLALTLGTAEYAAVTDTSPIAIAQVLSVTGSAWSCIGYPPQEVNSLTPGTADGNCISPDSYPLGSDIGDIFIYQPYYEFEQAGDTTIASNHSGSTNRGAFLVRPQANDSVDTPSTSASPSAPVTSSASGSVGASGVVYTLQTVADGSLGDHVFRQALVTFQLVSDPKWVTSQPSPVNKNKTLYENRVGNATVTVDDGGQVITAQFDPGEVYVRYDTGAGIAGFGSQISPTYPIALNCSDSAYPDPKDYKVDCLRGEIWNYLNPPFPVGYDSFRSGILDQLIYPVNPSASVQALPQSLSKSTLLTGPAHTCAGVYTIDLTLDSYFPGNLGVCPKPAPHGLNTSKGELFVRDLEGGTLNLGHATIVADESGAGGGWDLANSGWLRVELLKNDN